MIAFVLSWNEQTIYNKNAFFFKSRHLGRNLIVVYCWIDPLMATRKINCFNSKLSYGKEQEKESIIFPVCLADSVLAFHRHGMQGRSLRNSDVTQEIVDHSRAYRLVGHDKYVFFIDSNSFICDSILILYKIYLLRVIFFKFGIILVYHSFL